MANDSPTSIIYDIHGNPVGLILDGTVYRLQTEAKINSWFGSTAPTVGQKTSAESIPVVLPSDQSVNVTIGTINVGTADQGFHGTIDQSWYVEITDGYHVIGTDTLHPIRIDPTGTTTQPISGTVTADIGTTGGLALDSTLTNGTQKSQIWDGSNVLGTALHPVKIDPTGTTTQPVSGTVTANAGTGTFNVSGSVTANQGTSPWSDDVTDRSGRLLGVVYGSQGQQVKQTPTNFNTQVELAVGSTLIDPRSIRTLTNSDTVTVVQPTAANLSATVTQGTGGSSPWMIQGTTPDGYAIVGNTFPISAVDNTGILRALNAITDGGKILAVQDETTNDLLREILDKLKVMSFYLSQMADIDLENI